MSGGVETCSDRCYQAGWFTMRTLRLPKSRKGIFLAAIFVWIGANLVIDTVALLVDNLGDTEHSKSIHVSPGSLWSHGTIVTAPLAFVLGVLLLSWLISSRTKWATRTGTVALVLWMLLIGVGVGLQGAVGGRASHYTPERWHAVMALGWVVVIFSVPLVVTGAVYLAGTRARSNPAEN
jgi:hypothetical protein